MQKNPNPLFAEERKRKIMNFIKTNTHCSVSELAKLFDITPATIRSDLRELEKNGSIIRTHGGAVLRNKIEQEEVLDNRKNDDKKMKIAQSAIAYVHDGDTLALDTGTTALAFANALIQSSKKNLKIITSDLMLLHTFEKRQDFEIISIGGEIRHGFHFACGDIAIRMLSAFHVDKFFLTTSAIDLVQGLTTPNAGTAHLKAKMMAIANETILLVDSTKFNKVCFCKFADLSQLSRIIVDDAIEHEQQEHLRKTIQEVILA